MKLTEMFPHHPHCLRLIIHKTRQTLTDMLDRHQRQTWTVLLQHAMDRLVGVTSFWKHFKRWCGEDGSEANGKADRVGKWLKEWGYAYKCACCQTQLTWQMDGYTSFQRWCLVMLFCSSVLCVLRGVCDGLAWCWSCSCCQEVACNKNTFTT